MIAKNEVIGLIRSAIEEDMGGYGDITSRYLIDDKSTAIAVILCKEKQGAVVCGTDIAKYVFAEVDPSLQFKKTIDDGQKALYRQEICTIEGKSRSILSGERLALNFMQRLSAIATKTEKFASICAKYGVRVCETRKTTPNLRKLEKYAVLCGGGYNHRFGLFDGVLIKDNHIIAAKGIKNAIDRVREKMPHNLKIEVEVADLTQLNEAIRAKADIIMLDNMDVDMIREAVLIVRSNSNNVLIEVSGNVSLEMLEDICKTKVDIISVGELTHSIKSVDLSLDFKNGQKQSFA